MRPVYGTSFKYQKQAWEVIFKDQPLIKSNCSEVVTDGGSEFDSTLARQFFRTYGIKMINIRKRKHIYSRGSAIAEN